jgi:hypothetical protein
MRALKEEQIRGLGSAPRCHGSPTLLNESNRAMKTLTKAKEVKKFSELDPFLSKNLI